MKCIAAGRVMWVLLASLAIGASALAHHSYAMFDMTKRIEVQGVVKEFRWTNPHSWLVMMSSDAAGKQTEVRIEMNGPGYLARNGWKRESLKPGDAIKTTLHPLRDGSPGGDLVKVVFADGRELSAELKLSGPSSAAPAAGEQR